MTRNPVEDELNAIRINHYEQTKNMTDRERTAYYKAKAQHALKRRAAKGKATASPGDIRANI
jgi:hypothetical protein